jgi:hypothetical protein
MKFSTLDVYQNAWYRSYGIKRIKLYNYNDIFKNDDLKIMNGNSGIQKYRSNMI